MAQISEVKVIGNFDKQYFDIVNAWETCSEEEAEKLTSYIADLFKETVTDVYCLKVNGDIYITNPDTETKIAIHPNTLEYGFAETNLDIITPPDKILTVFLDEDDETSDEEQWLIE